MRRRLSESFRSLVPAIVCTSAYMGTLASSWVMSLFGILDMSEVIAALGVKQIAIFWAGICVGFYAGRHWKDNIDGENGKPSIAGGPQTPSSGPT